jgi:hypothetical protein
VERLLWFNSQSLAAHCAEVAGTYTSRVSDATCTVQFVPSPKGVLKGTFSSEGEELELIASISQRTGYAYGFLLEPFARAPVAFFRARLVREGIALELDVPDFDEMIEGCELERIVLHRTTNANVKS